MIGRIVTTHSLVWPRWVWDEGDEVHLSQVEAPTTDELDLEFVRTKHLRVVNGSVEDDYIEHLIRTSNFMAHKETRRSLQTQTWELVLDRFPAGDIILPRPPLQSVTSITYLDSSGDEQVLAGSPEVVQVLAPQGPTARKGRIRPLAGTLWPTTLDSATEAVVVRYVAGYPTLDDIPADITHGRLMVIGEMYAQRKESVHGPGLVQNPAILSAKALWNGYKVFG